MSIAPDHDQRQRQDQNQSLGGLDPNIPKNEPVTPDNALTPDSMTPPTRDEMVRQKSYAQMRREHETTEQEKKEEEARMKAQPKIAGGHLSVAMQPQPVPVHRGPPGIRPSAQGEIELREGETPHRAAPRGHGAAAQVRGRRRPQAEGRRGPAVPGRRCQDGRGRGPPASPSCTRSSASPTSISAATACRPTRPTTSPRSMPPSLRRRPRSRSGTTAIRTSRRSP